MLKKLLTAVIAVSIITGTVCAAADYTIEYNANDNTYIIGSDGADLSVLVLESGKSLSELTGVLKPAFARQLEGNGERNEMVVDLSNSPSGKYDIYYQNGANTGLAVSYYNKNTANLTAVNAATSAAELKSALVNDETKLGINKDDVTKYPQLSTILYNMYFAKSTSKGFANMVDFTKKYNSVLFCLSTAELKTVEQFEKKLYYYQTSTGISYINEFQNLSGDIQQALFTIFQSYNFSELECRQAYIECVVLASVAKSAKWSDLKQLLTVTYQDVARLNTGAGSTYLALRDKEAVFKKIQERAAISPYKSIADLRNGFNEIVNECKNEEEKGTPGSGNVSGGGTVKKEITTKTDFPVSTGSENQYSDMDAAKWAVEAVAALNEKDVLAGYPDGTFKPLSPVSRAEFTKMLVRAFQLSGNTDNSFSDVKDSDWYNAYVKTGVANQIIKGVGDSFMPNHSITRQDAAVMLYRAVSRVQSLESGSVEFADHATISDYAKEAVYAMKYAGVIQGVGDNDFEPMGETSRAAAAKMIYNALRAAGLI